MQLSFATEKLREICIDPRVGPMGDPTIRILRLRLADLRAARAYSELVVGFPSPDGLKADMIKVQIGADYEMILRVDHVETRLDSSGNVDWERTDRVLVESLKLKKDK